MLTGIGRWFGMVSLMISFGCSDPQDSNPVVQWPSVELKDLHTNQRVLLDWSRKPGVVNVWATWCGPCREEMPSLEALRGRIHRDLEISAISVDDDLNLAREFLLQYQLDLPVYFGESRNAIEKALKIEAYPVTFVVGRGGEIIQRVDGSRNWASPDMVRYFESLSGGEPMPFPTTAVQ